MCRGRRGTRWRCHVGCHGVPAEFHFRLRSWEVRHLPCEPLLMIGVAHSTDSRCPPLTLTLLPPFFFFFACHFISVLSSELTLTTIAQGENTTFFGLSLIIIGGNNERDYIKIYHENMCLLFFIFKILELKLSLLIYIFKSPRHTNS